MGIDAPPVRYFPIDPSPYRMKAGLHAFGTDFGNGAADRQFFQHDREAGAYAAAKERTRRGRAGVLAQGPPHQRAHEAVLAWIHATWNEEHPERPLPPLHPTRTSGLPITNSTAPDAESYGTAYAQISSLIQEDLTVLHRPAKGEESAIAVFVDFPSGWRPESIVGATFARIHAPVPGFADDDAQARAMTSSMIDRGPYVRFVWTLSADDALDHHPEDGGRRPWTGATRAWLRVERQVTVPFPTENASLFLIRTYLYPFEDLSPGERGRLRGAVDAMPADIARYKGLEGEARHVALRLLLD